MEKQFHEILLSIVEMHGKQKIADPRIIGMMLDQMPHAEKKVINIFRQAVKEEIGVQLLELKNDTLAIRKVRIHSLKSTFRENHGYTETADYVVDSFLFALGWIDSINEDDPDMVIEEDVDMVIEKNLKDNLRRPGFDFDTTLDLPSYKLPPLSLLNDYDSRDSSISNEELLSSKNRIVETLASFNIKIDKIKGTVGPAVTLYEIIPAPGIRISKIKKLEDDIALSLGAQGIRLMVPLPGKSVIGIEYPNQKLSIVSIKSIITSKKFQEAEMKLPVALGKTISNDTFVFDLTKMPHLLIAGASGQGKSVLINIIIASLLYRMHPAQLKFVLINPKIIELSPYSKIEGHFLSKAAIEEDAIVTGTLEAINTLNTMCNEMDKRLDLLQNSGVKDIEEYNDLFVSRKLDPGEGHRYLPFIVVIIDEFANLMFTAGRKVEQPIARLAQKARIVGVHLIIATHTPTAEVITDVIKNNIPGRIAFRMSNQSDSMTFLDRPGAESLIGPGDMLFQYGNEPIRLQGGFIDTSEVDLITKFIGEQRGYPSALILKTLEEELVIVDLEERDAYFNEAARLMVQHQQGSTSLIQRKLSLGYNRAGRIVDQLEAAGILGPFEGSNARQVLVQDEFSLEQILDNLS